MFFGSIYVSLAVAGRRQGGGVGGRQELGQGSAEKPFCLLNTVINNAERGRKRVLA